MSPSHKDDIFHHPKPMNVKTMLAFLGLCNYSRHHVPDFPELTYPLRQMVNDQGMRNLSNILCWTTEADTSFISLKQHLSAAAALAIPDYNRMFYLDASEKVSSLPAALYQKGEGGSRQVCRYASTPLEKYEQRHPICAAFASALALVIQKTPQIVLHHPLTVRTSHSTVQYVTSQAFTMTGGRQKKIEAILTQPHILFIHEGVNMAEGLLEGEPHCCVRRTKKEDSLRTELYETPLENPDLILFTDGCCFKGNDGLQSGFAVTVPTETGFEQVQAVRILGSQSAQRAEILALTAALRLAENHSVNIYTDSAYAHMTVHVALKEWQRNNFQTATGTPIKHQDDILKLRDALLLPTAVAVIKCKGHSRTNDFVSAGNESADQAAKKGCRVPTNTPTNCESECENQQEVTVETVKVWQEKASPEEKSMWKSKGGVKDEDGIWRKI
ncbi:uncharacterized protein LOC133501470 [Syngnathoides biaculeatus]|uniref:uncharacterized protein LOC133501470 n=1 Tax=Syngnathoides biaculeatus TaxID=300417 RepID=UPI002ADDE1A6|nr:uncharacterized protein LOC133501470 [Syngnathoides biaculeatus]XP_061677252.1 uncharacterized protein LOC133501470 [Syngnathoides biaculeatus]